MQAICRVKAPPAGPLIIRVMCLSGQLMGIDSLSMCITLTTSSMPQQLLLLVTMGDGVCRRLTGPQDQQAQLLRLRWRSRRPR